MKAKKVFEKFAEESDPVKDMGIGLYGRSIDFKSIDELVDFFIDFLPAILKTKEIPVNIIYLAGAGPAYNWQYYSYLDNYVKRYFTINNKSTNLENFLISSWKKLLKMGYGLTKEEMEKSNQ
jgi:hypothetical protein